MIEVEVSVPPEPCSDEAYDLGCKCMRLDYEGSNWLGQPPVYNISKDCELHEWMIYERQDQLR